MTISFVKTVLRQLEEHLKTDESEEQISIQVYQNLWKSRFSIGKIESQHTFFLIIFTPYT